MHGWKWAFLLSQVRRAHVPTRVCPASRRQAGRQSLLSSQRQYATSRSRRSSHEGQSPVIAPPDDIYIYIEVYIYLRRWERTIFGRHPRWNAASFDSNRETLRRQLTSRYSPLPLFFFFSLAYDALSGMGRSAANCVQSKESDAECEFWVSFAFSFGGFIYPSTKKIA